MEMQEIRHFLAISRTLNFTKAAEECHVSQPALTRAIRKIEEELGGLLFSREPNNIHMTDLGRLIEPHLTEIMAHAGEARRTATLPQAGGRKPRTRHHVHSGGPVR
jgi:DNA-binding transcriptional LysR family regulator